jgi:hypothetical protein
MPDYFGKALVSFQANLDRKTPVSSDEQIRNLSAGMSNLASEIEQRLWQVQATLNLLMKVVQKPKHVIDFKTTSQKKSRRKR